MSAALQLGNQQLGADEVVSLLTSPQILPHLLRELAIEQAIASVSYTPAEFELAYRQLAQLPQFAHHSPEQMDWLVKRQLRLGKFKEETWGAQVEEEFRNHSHVYDQVLFSLIQSEAVEVVQELYFRLQEGEASFSELSTQYSQGPEARTNGLVGPLELRNIHPRLAQMLRISQPGQISPPFRVDQWLVIVRLERYISAELSPPLRQRLIEDKFEAWLKEKIALQSNQVEVEQWQEIPSLLLTEKPEVGAEGEESDLGADFTSPEEDTAAAPTPATHAATVAEKPVQKIARSLQLEYQKRHQRGNRIPEAALLALIPVVLGGWGVSAMLGWSWENNPLTPATIAGNLWQPIASEVPKEEAYRLAINAASEAVKLLERAQLPQDWDQIAQQWQQAIALLKVVPSTDRHYAVAQKKIHEYQGYLDYAKDRATNPNEVFRIAVNNALQAVKSSQGATSPEDWVKAATHWEMAIQLMQAVDSRSPHYDLAQEKAVEYQAYWQYAQHRSGQAL
ncbi:peptidylprolyl isomerase [Spirulina subsalsa FACHB-351]|uniref:peptidylprolyl isomerase n=1 Tax=Spirulina subsalsa FACHB-351 TaxID=234711 RepID=A0ABT3L0R0_9CYAN|nr:peptidylprolyl isomerase [Spirulina subsalsa]MCW6035089.1 peptidylprolyl isomerase [Spirulina subsalsa FACHB-351]